MSHRSHTLAKVPLFASLSANDVARLDRACAWRNFRPDEWLLQAQEIGDSVYFIVAGTVRVMVRAPGRDVIFTDLGEGAYFGELSVIDRKPRSASVLALNASLVATMPGRIFLDTMFGQPDACLQLLQNLAERIRQVNERIVEFNLLDVRHRVFSELIRLARAPAPGEHRIVISPPPLQSVIAARASTRREAVSRELSRLERLGHLKRRRGSWEIPDRRWLEETIRNAAEGE